MYSVPKKQFYLPFVLLGVLILLFIYNYRISSVDVYALPSSKEFTFIPRERSQIKYILQWPDNSLSPFHWMGEGNSSFVKNHCEYKNCFVTDDRNYFTNKPNQNFDAVVFNGRKVIELEPNEMLSDRLPHQKYIFGIIESAENFPVCKEYLDGFFNWTWTYKLDSNIRWGYFTIYNLYGTVVGPKMDMQWAKDYVPINDEIKYKLSSKTKAAAWFVSNCHTKSGRETFADHVHEELQRYGWSVDIFGRCGDFECPKDDRKSCYKMIENDYYFYFAFENSFSEDYVTEKLMNALNNYAVPVVYGGANYSRFLPEGSYLDGRKLGAENLARTMDQIMKNKTMYYNFFRWRNHYVYKDTAANVDICNLCAMLNDDEKVDQISVWSDFRSWWNGDHYEQNCGNSR